MKQQLEDKMHDLNLEKKDKYKKMIAKMEEKL